MLRSLELFGFKSFAERTEFAFAPGITCVVGPNGSGKSNVVDGIKWILGDQSAKSLRGKEMTDVIFNGSGSRKPSAFAEASLSFNNESRLIPIDSVEVKIGRRLYRSGDSEYLLNNNVVRLKDIKDLFMGTGAGTAAYSIIEQGRVDQILQSNPAARRVVFEEAAGISKYKARKVEAERKLERVGQNLIRLTDIVDEVETQLNATRSQATKAAQYRKLSTELKELWTGLAADDYRKYQRDITEAQASTAGIQEQIDELTRELDTIEPQAAALEQKLHEHDGRLRSLERQASSGREEIAAQDSTIKHQTSRLKELGQEIERVRRQRLGLVQRADSLAKELHATTEQLDTLGRAFTEQQSGMARRETEIAAVHSHLDLAQQRIRDARKSHDSVRVKLAEGARKQAGLESQLQVATDAVTAMERTLTELDARISHAEKQQDECRLQVEDAEQASFGARDIIESLRTEQSSLQGDHGQTERRVSELRERRSGAQARLVVLQDLERRQEGLGIGVKEILQRAATLDEAPWTSVIGTVGELVESALDAAPIIEIALGSRAQLVVVDDLQPLIDYMNRQETHILGRVGFVELSAKPDAEQRGSRRAASLRKLRWQTWQLRVEQLPNLDGQPGVMQRADLLLRESEFVPGLAARLLADTWVVESLTAGLELAHGIGVGARFVTLQGELIDSDGTLFVGTVPAETAVLSRKSELRQLRNEILRLDRGIETEVHRLSELLDSLNDRGDRLSNAEREFQARGTRLAEVTARLTTHDQEVQRLTNERSLQEDRLGELEQRREQASHALDVHRASLEEHQIESERLAEFIGVGERETHEISNALASLTHTAKLEQLELAKHEERLKSLRATHARLLDDQVQRDKQRQEAHDRLDELLRAQSSAQQQILTANSITALRYLTAESLTHDVRSAARQRNEIRLERQSLNRVGDDLQRRRRSIQDQQHQADLKLRETTHLLTALEQRIQEEYQITVAELATQGLSAYRAYLAEHHGIEDDSSPSSPSALALSALDPSCDSAPDPAIAAALAEGETDAASPPSSPSALDPSPLDPLAGLPQATISYDEVRPELESKVDRLRRRIKSLGSVNADALSVLDELESRFSQLSAQLQDLNEARATLEDIIRRINAESQRIFLETFETIRGHFRELFRKLFGGGEGDIILENETDVLECGIDIVARPPGKELRSLTLLSGGEKTMTAVGLLFAMFKSKPSPYCILDEVDAALDEANVDRYIKVVREFASATQFIVITHRKRTMTAGDVLYGVTMEQAGVSKRMSVKFEDVGENGEILKSAKSAA